MARADLWHRATALFGVTTTAVLVVVPAAPRHLTALTQRALSAAPASQVLSDALIFLLRCALLLTLGALLGVLGGALLRRRLVRPAPPSRWDQPGTDGLRFLAALVATAGLGVLAARALVLLRELLLPAGGADVLARMAQVLSGPGSPGQELFTLALRILMAGAALHLLAGGVALLQERRAARGL